ncbi:hypothetical protein Lsan_1325 [Legionella santicrucis]|uniref:Uncharacterized protein n=1 Tax=Legionella santicrucis TaxID=45074 RepID=A0A0W0Z2T4_9GAMM|nr:hypothetical protein Lsan_1325 [Legionella santicrucis]
MSYPVSFLSINMRELARARMLFVSIMITIASIFFLQKIIQKSLDSAYKSWDTLL